MMSAEPLQLQESISYPLSRRAGDRTHHWVAEARFPFMNEALPWRNLRRTQTTISGHSFPSIRNRCSKQIYLIPKIWRMSQIHPPISSESSSSTQEQKNTSESKTHRAVPGSFDEATMGIFRKTWHVVMNSPPEGDLPPDWHWATACGRRFSPQYFTIHDELELTPGQVLCTHRGCKKGWISVGILI